MLKTIFTFLFTILLTYNSIAQNNTTVHVVSKEDASAIPGASVYLENTTIGAMTNLEGLAHLKNIPTGTHILTVSFVGYTTAHQTLTFPLENTVLQIALEHDEEELEEITIVSTRSKRNIAAIPTRIEVVSAEELGEKAMMNSTNIAMVLRESTGIQMQQTSANSANQSIRIQGLDGRFTQLLKDGFPLFGGFSSGLSIMQIPPLDLKQVEIIKGSTSTLYGGGAIAGLVNLISKQPTDTREMSLMFDQTSRNNSALNLFYSENYGKWGVTLYTAGSLQKASDVNGDHFSDLPTVKSMAVNPSIFYNPSSTSSWRFSINASKENRIGGDMSALNDRTNSAHPFFEENNSSRAAFQVSYNNILSETSSIGFKHSTSYFKRILKQPAYLFKGDQFATFTEFTYSRRKETSDWVLGTAFTTERFKEAPVTTFDRSSQAYTFGAFAQNSWVFHEKMTLENGLRLDYNNQYGMFALPKVSLLVKFNDQISSRIGGGFGYKSPSAFTEEAEQLAYQYIMPIVPTEFQPETSKGVNADFNYRTRILNKQVSVSFNQLFFYTQVKNSLVLENTTGEATGAYEFVNSNSLLKTSGLETNLKLKYKHFVLFANYALNNVTLGASQKALTPKHSIGSVFMYEEHNKWRIGYEAYYKSSQWKRNGTATPHYWTMGFMAMRTFGGFSIYANFENFTDVKQANYQSMVTGAHETPSFVDLWAPTDGFVFNGGILIKL